MIYNGIMSSGEFEGKDLQDFDVITNIANEAYQKIAKLHESGEVEAGKSIYYLCVIFMCIYADGFDNKKEMDYVLDSIKNAALRTIQNGGLVREEIN